MNIRNIFLVFITIVALVFAAFWVRSIKNIKSIKNTVSPSATPSISDQINKTFNFQIPLNVEKAELKDINGGSGIGIATRDTVLADLPEIGANKSYQVFVDGKFLGNMRIAKGGWIFDGKINGKKVEIKIDDTTILEGSF